MGDRRTLEMLGIRFVIKKTIAITVNHGYLT
jgi:hypothetical protein